MRSLRLFIVGMMAMVALGIGGCCGGSEVKTENKSISTTLGKELQDLKDAYDQGIISERQYNEAKEKLMKQRMKNE